MPEIITEGNKLIHISGSSHSEYLFPFPIENLEERYLFSYVVTSPTSRLFVFFSYGGRIIAFNDDGDVANYCYIFETFVIISMVLLVMRILVHL